MEQGISKIAIVWCNNLHIMKNVLVKCLNNVILLVLIIYSIKAHIERHELHLHGLRAYILWPPYKGRHYWLLL